MSKEVEFEDNRKELSEGSIFLADGAIINYPAAERFRMLRAQIVRKNLKHQKYQVISVTSALPQEGKSVASVNFARGLGGNPNSRTLLIDCDLRCSVVHEYFGISKAPGIGDVLEERATLSAAIKNYSPGLDVMTAGSGVEDPALAVESQRFDRCLKVLREHYSYIILDCPPVLLCPEPITISSKVDGTIVVMRAWKTKRKLVQDAVEIIGKENILGLVVNDATDSTRDYMNYDYYGYYEHKGERKSREVNING